MSKIILALICVLTMLTTGFAVYLPVSAESDSSNPAISHEYTNVSVINPSGFTPQPMSVGHACNSTNTWYTVGNYNFASNDNYAGSHGRYGFILWSLSYNNLQHIYFKYAYQNVIRVRDENLNWATFNETTAAICESDVYTNAYGWHQYAKYTWHASLFDVVYIADFGIEGGNVHFGQYLYQSTTTHKITGQECWWKLEFGIGTHSNIASNTNGQINYASKGTPSSWSYELIQESGSGNSGHEMDTVYHDDGNVQYHYWAAVNSPFKAQDKLSTCADGSSLTTSVFGAEDMQDSTTITSGSWHAWTEWFPYWS